MDTNLLRIKHFTSQIIYIEKILLLHHKFAPRAFCHIIFTMKRLLSALIALAAFVALVALLHTFTKGNTSMGEKESSRGLRHHHSMDYEMEGRVSSFPISTHLGIHTRGLIKDSLSNVQPFIVDALMKAGLYEGRDDKLEGRKVRLLFQEIIIDLESCRKRGKSEDRKSYPSSRFLCDSEPLQFLPCTLLSLSLLCVVSSSSCLDHDVDDFVRMDRNTFFTGLKD
jgi:hypothetical protein